MRHVRRLGAEHQFRVRGHFNLARARGGIADGQPPHFGIVFRGDLHFERGHQVAIAADDLGAVLGEAHFVDSGLHGAGLVAGRPGSPAVDVTQQEETSGVVARGVFAPARDRQVVPAAVTRARGRDHDRVAAIREQVRLRRGIVRAAQPSHLGYLQLADARRRAHFLGARMRHRDIARRALLQQQLGGLHGDVGMEALAHARVEQRVGDRDDAHALVMRHVGTHQHARGFVGQAAGREVHGLVKAVTAARADRRQRRVVGRAPPRRRPWRRARWHRARSPCSRTAHA